MEIDRSANFIQIALVSGEQVIDDHDPLRAARHQTAHQRRSDESRPTRYQKLAHLNSLSCVIYWIVSPACETS